MTKRNKVHLKAYVHQHIASYQKGQTFVSCADMTDCSAYQGEYAVRLLGIHEFEFEYGEYDMNMAAVEAYEKMIVAERGQSEAKVQLLQDKIQSLLAITHEVSADE